MNKKYLETIKVYKGEVFHLSYHQQRVDATLGNSTILLKNILKPPQDGLYRCRILYDAESFQISYHPYVKRNIRRLKLVYDDNIQYDKKYADRTMIENLLNQKGRYDDILIVKNGYITDTSIANIALKQANKWFTPASPLLQGTTRKRLLNEGKLKSREIHVKDLKEYSQIALMNAMIDFDIITDENIREIIC